MVHRLKPAREVSRNVSDASPQTLKVTSELERQRPHRSIPSLDGLRAISVIAVVLSHFNGYSALPKSGALHAFLTLFGLGGVGVSMFFIISGFLITTLLLQEEERSGTLRMGRFYFRRALRIFPPFYVYLMVAAAVAWAHHRALHGKLLLAAGMYVMNYVPYLWVDETPSFWYLAHTWSLAVEEQFYLFWPLLLVLIPRRLMTRFCVATLLIVPLLRLLTLLFLPMYSVAEQWSRVFHGSVDLLALGALLGLLMRRERFANRVARLFHPALLMIAALFVPLSAILRSHTPAWFDALFILSLTGVALAFLLLWVVLRPHTLVGCVLNWRPIRHVGRISYSLYLWQQMFVGPLWVPNRAVNLVSVIIAAELSFWLVEQPSLRLRALLERHWFSRSPEIHAS